jgi:hypothetical protein
MSEEKNLKKNSEKKNDDTTPAENQQDLDQQPSSANATADKPEPISQPQPGDMEVHKHPHDVAHKKNWGEYLLEFFMIFLAVFLGFLAENQREQLLERRRERDYISTLLNDLRLDTAWLNTVDKSTNTRLQNIDSVILFLSGSQKNEIPVNIYQHLRQSMEQTIFIPYSGTISQLKNAGGLRLITNRKAVDSIEDYDRLMERLDIRRSRTDQFTHDLSEALNKTVIGNDVMTTLYDSGFYKKRIDQKQTIKLNSQNLNELINDEISLRVRIVSDLAAFAFVKRKATGVISVLQNEYHLE